MPITPLGYHQRAFDETGVRGSAARLELLTFCPLIRLIGQEPHGAAEVSRIDGTFPGRRTYLLLRGIMKAYFTNLTTRNWLFLVVPAVVIAYPVVRVVVPAVVHAVVPEVVRSVLSVI